MVKASIEATNAHSAVLKHVNGCFAALHETGEPFQLNATPVKLRLPWEASELSE